MAKDDAPTPGTMPKTQDPDGMPGDRAGLPPGSLSKPYFGPQGDESRQPPADAPADVKPAPTLEPGKAKNNG